jgi:hypothetical protein
MIYLSFSTGLSMLIPEDLSLPDGPPQFRDWHQSSRYPFHITFHISFLSVTLSFQKGCRRPFTFAQALLLILRTQVMISFSSSFGTAITTEVPPCNLPFQRTLC